MSQVSSETFHLRRHEDPQTVVVVLVIALVVVVGQSGKQRAHPPSQTVGSGVVVDVGSAVVGGVN